MQANSKGEIFLSPQVESALDTQVDLEINDYNLELIRQLSLGLSQSEICSLIPKNNMPQVASALLKNA